ncbi:EamA family transporter [Flavobacterium humi]|uniref:EamA family transporter n=1 Tax=Flavobacterium humi TaxID=2562683 RepID=A0A4Z0LC49_9FLAO|nr:EamA family transporter [Flavobacterium humi]TGD59435.1 EamA family transporter [Flavobacterium humi]
MQINKYYISAFSSFFIWGFFSLALKPLHEYPSLDILFYRVFYGTVLLLAINLFFRKEKLKSDLRVFNDLEKKVKFKTFFLTVLGGFLLIFNWFLFIYAVNHVSLKSASFAYLICPILTTILAFFILKEKLSQWQWFSVVLCLISCGILSYGDLTGLFYSLVIAFTFALYLVSQRKNNQFDRFVVLTVQLVIASLVILPFFPFYRGETPAEPLFYILLIVIVVLFTIIPLFLNLYALKGMNSSAVGILMYTNPLINFLLAIFYFHEEINQAQIISYSLILISVIVFNEKHFFKSKKIK